MCSSVNMAKLSPDERFARARASIASARAELITLPPRGRERTPIIARTRKHLLAARNTLAPLLRLRTGVDPTAKRLQDEVENLWPGASTGKK